MTTAEIHNIADAVSRGLRKAFPAMTGGGVDPVLDPEFDEPAFDKEMRAILAKIEKALEEIRKERE